MLKNNEAITFAPTVGSLAPASDGQRTGFYSYATYFAKLHQLLLDVTVTNRAGEEVSAEDGITGSRELLETARQVSRKAIVIGNGGSAAIASHLALDLWNSARVPATVFNDAAQLTCLANDFGYERVFSKAVEMFAQEGDVLIAISSSGRSQNILNAVTSARAIGCEVITFSGFSRQAPLVYMGDFNFYVDSDHYGFVEAAHMAISHYLTDVMTKKRQVK